MEFTVTNEINLPDLIAPIGWVIGFFVGPRWLKFR